MSETIRQRAYELGADHAADESLGKAPPKLYSGKQVATALLIDETLSGDEYVALRESYEAGRRDYW